MTYGYLKMQIRSLCARLSREISASYFSSWLNDGNFIGVSICVCLRARVGKIKSDMTFFSDIAKHTAAYYFLLSEYKYNFHLEHNRETFTVYESS